AQRLAPRVFHSCSLLSPPSPATCLRSLHDALPIFDFNASGPALPIAAVYTAGGALVLLGRHLLQREGSTLWSPTTQVLLGCLALDRKSTRLNSSHVKISYAVFCLKKKKNTDANTP